MWTLWFGVWEGVVLCRYDGCCQILSRLVDLDCFRSRYMRVWLPQDLSVSMVWAKMSVAEEVWS